MSLNIKRISNINGVIILCPKKIYLKRSGSESQHPPANLLVELFNTLNISADELLGIKQSSKAKLPDTRLLRRLQQIEKMEASKKRQLLNVIDTFIEVNNLKQEAEA